MLCRHEKCFVQLPEFSGSSGMSACKIGDCSTLLIEMFTTVSLVELPSILDLFFANIVSSNVISEFTVQVHNINADCFMLYNSKRALNTCFKVY
jgi:hypothetical protein